MDVRLEAHPEDRHQWRVYLNQYFFQFPSRAAAQRMFEHVLETLGQAAPLLPNPPNAPRVERRRRARQWV